eukprot:TRINITY_DN61997_c0_g1_i1.p2 TRINITY_DN61997_c0_g1~~TRINITY_DN61997_c0_g1_i1.p2  ORF type:complete len:174 (+),score=53.26 TRINITY_DN61997_c0_g1_i1:85-606(+)
MDGAFETVEHSRFGQCPWRQTEAEVELYVPVPKGTKAKECRVQCTPSRITAGLLGREHINDMELCHAVVAAEMTWQLDDGEDGNKVIAITLPKQRSGVPWRALLLQDNPKPPKTDNAFASWNKDSGDAGAVPAAAGSRLARLVGDIEPGTLAACVMLAVAVCVGCFKFYFGSR